MAVSVLTTGVFPTQGFGDLTDATGLHIPLASIKYQGGTITQTNARDDYRALLRGINQTYYDFMTGTATGTDNPDDFNTPAYFSMERRKPSVGGTDSLPTLANTTSSKFIYELGHGGSDGLDLPTE